MADFNLGRIKFKWKGTWTTATAYVKDDVVFHGGSAYVVKINHSSTSFENDLTAAKLELMTEGVEYLGSWAPNTAYKRNQLFNYNGSVYRVQNDYTSTSQFMSTNANIELYVAGQKYVGAFADNSYYEPGDVISYGNSAYICVLHAHDQSILDTNYFNLLVPGSKFEGTYNGATAYQYQDIVRYGGFLYISKGDTTGNLPTNTTYWSVLVEGFLDRGSFNIGTLYLPGDIVAWGPRKYKVKGSVASVTGQKPSNTTFWEVYAYGNEYRSTYAGGTQYYPGDIVLYGGRLYETVTDPLGVDPTYTATWTTYLPGLKWMGVYSSSATYKVDEVVEYQGSSYVCTQQSTNNQPNISGAYWNLVAQGSNDTVTTARGDLIVRGAVANQRLPVGPAGSFLISDGTDVKWGMQAPEATFYVALTGDDTNDGRTPATAWRTIQHAASQTFNYFTTNANPCSISVFAGVYEELCPIKLGKHVVIEGMGGLGSVWVEPDSTNDKGFGVGKSKDGSTNNANSEVFQMNNGTRLRNIVFRNFSTGAVLACLDPGTGPNDTSVWITSQSPYVQNCTNLSANCTGMKVDGALHNGGYKSMVANDWTQINSDGIGIHVLNDGRTELVSVFTYYCHIGYLAESGGKIRALVGNNSYGEYGSVARGYSQNEIPLKGNLQLEADVIDSVVTITNDVTINNSYKDDDGNIWLAGYTNPNLASGIPGLTSGASYMFVAGVTAAGALIFQSIIAGSGDENKPGYLNAILELDGALYVVGSVTDSGQKGFIAKLNKTGTVQFEKTVAEYTAFTSLTTDFSQIYVAGNKAGGGAGVLETSVAGIIDWNSYISYNDSSLATLSDPKIVHASQPTSSTETYASAGDATAAGKLWVACNDTTNDRVVLVGITTSGSYYKSYHYPNIRVNNLYLDRGSGDGIYFALAGYDLNGSTKNAYLARITMAGNVAWQLVDNSATIDTEYFGVLAQGDSIYVSGWKETSNGSGVNVGLLRRITSNGSVTWGRTLADAGTSVGFRQVHLDGVNVVATGYGTGDDIVILNVQRDLTNGIGTVNSGTWTFSNYTTAPSNTTITTKAVEGAYVYASSATLNAVTYTSNITAVYTAASQATRAGFAGVGRGINFAVKGLLRKPKEGSVVHISGDNDTYFCVGVSNFVDPTRTSGNNPNARVLLTSNKEFLKAEVIAYINATYPALVYDQATCSRDVGLIVDALDDDLDYNSNASSIDAGYAYYNNSSGIYAITTQKTETLAAITYLKTIVDNVLKNTTPATVRSAVPQYKNVALVYEGSSDTRCSSNLDEVYNIINLGVGAASEKVGLGTCEIALDPPIPSNKVPNDNQPMVFREAFSQVRMTGHDFLDVGTGGFADTNYPVIIQEDYTQAPDQEREVLAENGGRVFYVTTDQDGNFRVGDYFKVEQATGRATLSSEEFDLSGLNELQLGSIKAGKQGATVNEFSTDPEMADNSDTAVPTEKAVRGFIKGGFMGTDAIWVPSGTTAQRPVSPQEGMVRFNTTLNTLEFYDGVTWSAGGGGGIIVASVSPNIVDPSVSSTLTILGDKFTNPTTVAIGGISIPSGSVTYVSANRLTVATGTSVLTALSSGLVDLTLTGSNGQSATYPEYIRINRTPTFTTSATLSNVQEGSAFNVTINTTDTEGHTKTYSLISDPNSLFTANGGPFTLNTSTGQITGTTPLVASDSARSFTLRITDQFGLFNDRTFTFTILNNTAPTVTSPTAGQNFGDFGTTVDSTYTTGVNIAFTASDSEGNTLSYAVAPSGDPAALFSNGLSLNTSTGNITGTITHGWLNKAYTRTGSVTIRVTDNASNSLFTDRQFNVVARCTWRYRVLYSRGYMGGGYRNSDPWNNVNRTQHSTDTSTNLGDIMARKGSYSDGTFSDNTFFMFGLQDAYDGKDTFSWSMNMNTDSGKATFNMSISRNDLAAVPYDTVRGYITGGDSNSAYDRIDFATENMLGTIAGGLGSDYVGGAWNDTKGFFWNGTQIRLTFATESSTSIFSTRGTHSKGWASKYGHYYIGPANSADNLAKVSYSTESVVSTLGNYPNTQTQGEHNTQLGQDNVYSIGMWNSANSQVNDSWKLALSNDTYSFGVNGHATLQPKGRDGCSSGGCASFG